MRVSSLPPLFLAAVATAIFGFPSPAVATTVQSEAATDDRIISCGLDILQLIDASKPAALDTLTILRSESEAILQLLNENPSLRIAIGTYGQHDVSGVPSSAGMEPQFIGSAPSEYREAFNRIRSSSARDKSQGPTAAAELEGLLSAALRSGEIAWREDPTVIKVVVIITDSIAEPSTSSYADIGKALRENNIVPVFVVAPAAKYCGPNLSQICGSLELQEYAARSGNPSLSDPVLGVQHFYRSALEQMKVTGFVFPVDMQFTGYSRAFSAMVQTVTEAFCSPDSILFLESSSSSAISGGNSRSVEISNLFDSSTPSVPTPTPFGPRKPFFRSHFPFLLKSTTPVVRPTGGDEGATTLSASTFAPERLARVTARRRLRSGLPWAPDFITLRTSP